MSVETDLARLLLAVRTLGCAASQISGVFHEALYGQWGGYEHAHHPACCDPVTHEPKARP